MKKIFLIGIGVLLILGSCAENQKNTPAKSKKLDAIASSYYEEYLKFHPLEATAQGDLRYNSDLPINIAPDFLAKEKQRYTEIQNRLQAIHYSSLSDEDKVVYDVLQFKIKDYLEGANFHLEQIPFTQFDGLPLEFPLMGNGQGSQPFQTVQQYEDWAKRMEKFPQWMEQAELNFKSGIQNKMVLPKVLVLKMIQQMKADEIISPKLEKNIFFGPIRKFPPHFTESEQQNLTQKYTKVVHNSIIPAYQKMGKFLENEYLKNARSTDGINALPEGEKLYKYLAKSWTTTQKTPEDIFQIGKIQVEVIRAEMLKVKEELGYDGYLVDFIKQSADDPKAKPYHSKEEILAAFQKIYNQIKPKLKTYFNVIPTTPFEIRATEAFRETTASAEYIQGTPDGKRPGIFYIPIPDPKKFNVTSGMESLFLHEAIPGHHYQVSLQQENTKLPKFMRFGWIGAYGEGWAHYCETLGAELGLYKDPYQKMGYLNDQMLRAVRLVVDTGLHTGMMDREVAIGYYLQNIADTKENATAAIERYMAIPGQALAYKIGSLKIIELRDKYTKELGPKFNIASFHDEVLSQGCLPLDVLDRKMQLWAKKQK
ncbi:MAG: DUF885 domain-containing protein [Bacteroidetes bacterium]|nr:DUF885 domain-containing protein [Bacteroidota bacterium]